MITVGRSVRALNNFNFLFQTHWQIKILRFVAKNRYMILASHKKIHGMLSIPNDIRSLFGSGYITFKWLIFVYCHIWPWRKAVIVRIEWNFLSILWASPNKMWNGVEVHGYFSYTASSSKHRFSGFTDRYFFKCRDFWNALDECKLYTANGNKNWRQKTKRLDTHYWNSLVESL